MPQLDKGFEVFVNWQTAIFCLTIYFAMYIFRTVIEAIPASKVKIKGTISYHLWNEVFLPLGPFGTGVLIALLAKKFPWPMPVADIRSAKVMYGLVCGGGSGWFYGRFRAWARVKTERKAGQADDSEAPPSVPPAPEAPAVDPKPPVT